MRAGGGDILTVPVFAGMSAGVLDSPGRMSTTAFFPVCNMRCAYCYNKSLIGALAVFSLQDVLVYVEKIRRFATDAGIVLSGGEPTAHALLGQLIDAVPAEIPITVHTNGLVISEAVGRRANTVIVSVKTGEDGHIPSSVQYARHMAQMFDAYSGVGTRILRCVQSDDAQGTERNARLNAVAAMARKYAWQVEAVPCVITKNLANNSEEEVEAVWTR